MSDPQVPLPVPEGDSREGQSGSWIYAVTEQYLIELLGRAGRGEPLDDLMVELWNEAETDVA